MYERLSLKAFYNQIFIFEHKVEGIGGCVCVNLKVEDFEMNCVSCSLRFGFWFQEMDWLSLKTRLSDGFVWVLTIIKKFVSAVRFRWTEPSARRRHLFRIVFARNGNFTIENSWEHLRSSDRKRERAGEFRRR